MTPKEKAQELYNKMLQWQDNADIYIERNITSISAKQSALIAVDEILNELDLQNHILRSYWYDVQHEINQL